QWLPLENGVVGRTRRRRIQVDRQQGFVGLPQTSCRRLRFVRQVQGQVFKARNRQQRVINWLNWRIRWSHDSPKGVKFVFVFDNRFPRQTAQGMCRRLWARQPRQRGTMSPEFDERLLSTHVRRTSRACSDDVPAGSLAAETDQNR